MRYTNQRRDDVRMRAEATAKAILAQSRRTPAPPPLEEEPMKHYIYTPIHCSGHTASLPAPPVQASLDRVLEALAEQNQLLVDLLGAVNALTAATLSIQQRL